MEGIPSAKECNVRGQALLVSLFIAMRKGANNLGMQNSQLRDCVYRSNWVREM
jgi:hypothetical protein